MSANSPQEHRDINGGLLLFRVGQRRFALPDRCVSAIAPTQPVTPLPFTPAWVEGLISVGGRILPQASVAALLGEVRGTVGELILVQAGLHACALHVDEVLARVEASDGSFQPFQQDGEGYVGGEWRDGERSALILDIDRFAGLFTATPPTEGDPGLLGNPEAARTAEAETALACLVFSVGSERYALPLTTVSELGEAPPCTPIPGAPAFVAGIGALREAPLLLVDLATLLERPRAEVCHMLVLEHAGLRLGLLVDAIDGIQSFGETQIRALGEHSGDVCAVVHSVQGQVLGLLAVDRLLNTQRLTQIASYAPALRQQEQQQVRHMVQHLQFGIGAENFAVALEAVQCIAPWTPPEPLEHGDSNLAGLVNIDGEIVPVLDRARLLREGDAGTPPEAWLVLNAEGRRWALAVDRAQAIVDLTVDSIESIGNGRGLVHAIATVEQRLLSLLSLAALRGVATP